MNHGAALERSLPLLCWIAAVLTSLLICLKILSYGFIPSGDARRHVAKPFADKPYSEIIVMRPEYVVDHSPGWEWLLGLLHRVGGWDEDALLSFSVMSLLLAVLCFPLLWLRHPEAWLAAVLAQTIAIPELMIRWTQGRPYLLSEAILIALLFSWSKETERNPPWWKVAATSLGFCLSVWMHGAWYLWVLVLVAFALAQRWRAALWLAACWLVGTIAGALLTGHPWAFLKGAIFMAACVYQEHLPKWMLVGEFQPSAGEFPSLCLLAIIYIWRRQQGKPSVALTSQPVFWMILLNWILGLMADRFWADWGLPSALVWMALQFDDSLPDLWQALPFRPSPNPNPNLNPNPPSTPDLQQAPAIRRLLACGLIVLPLYLDATNDLSRRYTSSLLEPFVNGADPNLHGWMPAKNGIFYAGNMRFFYNTFFKNPQGGWRYIAGFEPALMPADDLKIYRDIQRNGGAVEAFEPWARKMRPEDRLAVESPTEPVLAPLEWKHATGAVWIGRLPSANPSPQH
jgi:hypothetical protein